MNDKESKIEELQFLVSEGDLNDAQVMMDIQCLSAEIAHYLRCEAILAELDGDGFVEPMRLTAKQKEVLYHLLDGESYISTGGILRLDRCGLLAEDLHSSTFKALREKKVIRFCDQTHEWYISPFGLELMIKEHRL